MRVPSRLRFRWALPRAAFGSPPGPPIGGPTTAVPAMGGPPPPTGHRPAGPDPYGAPQGGAALRARAAEFRSAPGVELRATAAGFGQQPQNYGQAPNPYGAPQGFAPPQQQPQGGFGQPPQGMMPYGQPGPPAPMAGTLQSAGVGHVAHASQRADDLAPPRARHLRRGHPQHDPRVHLRAARVAFGPLLPRRRGHVPARGHQDGERAEVGDEERRLRRGGPSSSPSTASTGCG